MKYGDTVTVTGKVQFPEAFDTDGGRTFAEWSAEFDCDEGRERELTELIGNGVFQGGFDALKRQVR